MSGRVGVHLVTLGGIELRSRLEQPGTEGHRLFVGGSGVLDVEVEVHLLGAPMRPVGWNMVRRQLHANPPLSGGVDHTVPSPLLEGLTAEDASPEGALGMQVSRVEHDHLAHHVHDRNSTRWAPVVTPGCSAGEASYGRHQRDDDTRRPRP